MPFLLVTTQMMYPFEFRDVTTGVHSALIIALLHCAAAVAFASCALWVALRPDEDRALRSTVALPTAGASRVQGGIAVAAY